MNIPAFIQFYSYNLEAVLSMHARTFFSMCNAMIRLKAKQNAELATISLLPNADKATQERIISGWINQSEGADKIIEQAKLLKRIRR